MNKTYSYNMDPSRMGKAVIFNQSRFDRFPPRDYSDSDCYNVYTTLKELGFSVENCQNYSGKDIEEKLLNVAAEDHSKACCFVCVMLSYGDQGAVYGKDHKIIQIDYIMEFFKGNCCPSLAGKPKIFIFQACNRDLYNFSGEEADTTPDKKLYRIPAEANFLMVWSLVPGNVPGWSDRNKGSPFITALCQLLRRNPQMEIQRLLTNVLREVAYELEKNCPRVFQKSGRRLPCVINMLTKQVFLASNMSN